MLQRVSSTAPPTAALDSAHQPGVLQAHDFEAYQELLRTQTGEGLAPGERYEAISVFLSETEEYLHRCLVIDF